MKDGNGPAQFIMCPENCYYQVTYEKWGRSFSCWSRMFLYTLKRKCSFKESSMRGFTEMLHYHVYCPVRQSLDFCPIFMLYLCFNEDCSVASGFPSSCKSWILFTLSECWLIRLQYMAKKSGSCKFFLEASDRTGGKDYSPLAVSFAIHEEVLCLLWWWVDCIH
jgi:hypothetical protein